MKSRSTRTGGPTRGFDAQTSGTDILQMEKDETMCENTYVRYNNKSLNWTQMIDK